MSDAEVLALRNNPTEQYKLGYGDGLRDAEGRLAEILSAIADIADAERDDEWDEVAGLQAIRELVEQHPDAFGKGR